MRKLQLMFLFLLTSHPVFSQQPDWINYTNGRRVQSTVIEDNYLWTATTGGLVKLNLTTGENIFFSKPSGLPDNDVRFSALDENGNKWVGTSSGLAKFNDTNWIVYNTSNSGLPDNYISSLQ